MPSSYALRTWPQCSRCYLFPAEERVIKIRTHPSWLSSLGLWPLLRREWSIPWKARSRLHTRNGRTAYQKHPPRSRFFPPRHGNPRSGSGDTARIAQPFSLSIPWFTAFKTTISHIHHFSTLHRDMFYSTIPGCYANSACLSVNSEHATGWSKDCSYPLATIDYVFR